MSNTDVSSLERTICLTVTTATAESLISRAGLHKDGGKLGQLHIEVTKYVLDPMNRTFIGTGGG